MSTFKIKMATPRDRIWMRQFLAEHWGSHLLVSRGRIYDASLLPAFIAHIGDKPVGLCTYHRIADQLEITSLNSLQENIGIGSALISAILKKAKQQKCRRIWLITTNDNLHALGFYQRRGFTFCRIYPDQIELSRQLKPEIPLYGQNGIPIRDELELEILL